MREHGFPIFLIYKTLWNNTMETKLASFSQDNRAGLACLYHVYKKYRSFLHVATDICWLRALYTARNQPRLDIQLYTYRMVIPSKSLPLLQVQCATGSLHTKIQSWFTWCMVLFTRKKKSVSFSLLACGYMVAFSSQCGAIICPSLDQNSFRGNWKSIKG